MKRILLPLLLLTLLLGGCHRKPREVTIVADGSNDKQATDVPELPYLMKPGFTPEIGVWYKVMTDRDTLFAMVDYLDGDSMQGTCYTVEQGSNCSDPQHIDSRRMWRRITQHATVYEYRDPTYLAIHDYRYSKEIFDVEKKSDIEYATASGFWCSKTGAEDKSYAAILGEGLVNSLMTSKQHLTMDIYMPCDDTTARRPLLLLLHGGGFYVGDKSDEHIASWCHDFAAKGYVAVSINYRMGFKPTKASVTRTGYRALQDAHAAMRYLMENAEDYGIDTNMMFVGGTSAGAITALNLAFMRDKDRPTETRRHGDLGGIDACGNAYRHEVKIKAVANMWGAVNSLALLRNNTCDIISFHGDADPIVPCNIGYPFSEYGEWIGERVFGKMYGSIPIDQRAQEMGMRSEIYLFPGQGHSLHRNDDGSMNRENYLFIEDKITQFFYTEMVATPAQIRESRNDPRGYYVDGQGLRDISWKVVGGFIMGLDDNTIDIVWRTDAPKHTLTVCGRYPNGIGFETTYRQTLD